LESNSKQETVWIFIIPELDNWADFDVWSRCIIAGRQNGFCNRAYNNRTGKLYCDGFCVELSCKGDNEYCAALVL
jgi:hypothetical protein